MIHPHGKKPVFGLLAFAVTVALLVVNVGPIFWAVSTSLKVHQEILRYPPTLIPSNPTLEHYERIISTGFLPAVRNSVFYSASTILLGLLIGSVAAYGFSRFDFVGKRVAFFLILAGIPMSIGAAAILIPTYVFFSIAGMVDKWYTLILLYTAYNISMVVWILLGTFESIPKELDESAMMDGCSRLRILVQMIIPLAKPGLAASAIFLFIRAWNDFIAASIMINSSKLRPVQLITFHFMGFYGREWGPLMASVNAALLPTLLLFLFLQRYFVSGLSSGISR